MLALMNAVNSHATSMGHVLSSSSWLDAHFGSCRAEYTEMLSWAGIEPGARVLDAGCGTGSYVSLLHDAKATQVVALDAAMENIATLAQHWPLDACLPVCGVMASLPFRDYEFDAVWCANTLQYLDDAEALDAVRECARVVRPGGLIAVKDVDMTAFKISPAPPFLGLHLAESCVAGDDMTAQSRGSIRGRVLYDYLQRAGLSAIRQRSFVIDRFGPLSGLDARFWSEWLTYLAGVARGLPLPQEDQETWEQVSTPAEAEAFVSRPNFYGCELQVVAMGVRL